MEAYKLRMENQDKSKDNPNSNEIEEEEGVIRCKDKFSFESFPFPPYDSQKDSN